MICSVTDIARRTGYSSATGVPIGSQPSSISIALTVNPVELHTDAM